MKGRTPTWLKVSEIGVGLTSIMTQTYLLGHVRQNPTLFAESRQKTYTTSQAAAEVQEAQIRNSK